MLAAKRPARSPLAVVVLAFGDDVVHGHAAIRESGVPRFDQLGDAIRPLLDILAARAVGLRERSSKALAPHFIEGQPVMPAP